ncbi:hypothetical protein HLV37_04175 [Eggerthellaceae bacterium zg-1084]|uniref:Uncharacterized protein n=1 Tax=Berryella wangjianweii TaxID=2734634 RepID=A0A6M8J6D2_9ACTN|nr:hypothetical protein [Berryella wangjianweii]NPD31061.1 hypothetical protein [Berryella wangjianweii]NPD31923.1 hypothetical protein [Eggerthellaceae bacterium zg-997]QKF07486.1 hypothetical protein HLV38_04645 [Berryella wangjianweii]
MRKTRINPSESAKDAIIGYAVLVLALSSALVVGLVLVALVRFMVR